MKKIFYIFFLLIFFVFQTKKVFAADCENRNSECPKDGYLTCSITGECTTPKCIVGMVQVEGSWKFYCAEPVLIPTPSSTAAVSTPSTVRGCPLCLSGYHWSFSQLTCCKNGEVPECKTSSSATFKDCSSDEICQHGNGCKENRPTPQEICGYPGFPGKEACCYNPNHDPKYYCFEGYPNKQSNGCLCKFLNSTSDDQSPNNDQAPIDFRDLQNAIPSLKPEFTGGAGNVGSIISLILPYLYVIAGLLLLFYLIYGGFHMMVAAKDEKGLAEAKGKITNALTGFLLLFVSYWIVQIMEYILGIKIF